jgi:hypothetical protein
VIGGVLAFLRKRLDDYLRAELGGGAEPIADKVVFLGGDKLDPLTFTEGAVSELLVNVEEDRTLRSADPYLRVQEDGKPQRVQPDIRLVLSLLFVARFKQYDQAWDHVGKVIEYLQSNKVFDRATHADLPAGVDKLTVELLTQTFSELSDVWSTLRHSYHPSVLYRVRLVLMRDVKPAVRDQITKPTVINVHGMS